MDPEFDIDGKDNMDLEPSSYEGGIYVDVEPSNEPYTIGSLPPEVLSYIFTLAMPNRRLSNQVPFEVALSHVSAFWRIVALDTPDLWTKIDFYSLRSVARMTQYLQRSGSLLLDVCVDIYRYEKLRYKKSSAKLMKLALDVSNRLVQEIHRIRDLSIICYSKTSPFIMLHSFLKCSAPNLQRLVVKYDILPLTNPDPTSGPRIPILQGGSQRLSFLDTDLSDALPSTLSLRNLTTLYLHNLNESSQHTYASFIEILTTPQSLLYLSVQGTIKLNAWPLHQAGPQFALGNLKALRLLDDGMMAVKLLLSMSAPKLESLWLDCSFDNFMFLFDAPQMSTAAGRTKFPALKYLTIPKDNLYLSESFAQAFPTITHLHLPRANFFHSGQLQKALMAKWPSLHTLVFSMFKETNCNRLYSALNVALPLRLRSGHPIRKLLISEDHLPGIQITAQNICRQVDVESICSSNYQEIWWSKVDQQELSG